MATIKEGYADYPLVIRVSSHDSTNSKTIDLDIDMYNQYRAEKLGKEHGIDSTLAYMTINEAIALRDELNEAIRQVAGL